MAHDLSSEPDALLEQIFPNVREEVRRGDLTIGEASSAAKEFILKHYPLVVNVFICGSIVTNRFRKYSDVDLVGFVPTSDCYERHCVIYNGIPLDIQIVGKSNLTLMIKNALARGFNFTTNAISNGLIIVDLDGTAKEVQNYVVTEMSQRRIAPHPTAIKSLRFSVTELLIDFLTADNDREACACALTLFLPLMNIIIPEKSGCLAIGKHIPVVLEKFGATEEFDKLRHAYREALTGNRAPLINYAVDALKYWGGPYWDGKTQRGQMLQ